MERSANYKNVDNYEILSQYYDELLNDEDSLKYWLEYINRKDYHTVLELAAGSGLLSKVLKQAGKDVVASDISSAMKQSSLKNFDGEYLILNMIEFNLDRKFDLILCICDSINYLEIDELDSFFNCCFKHLNQNGRLIFDCHHIERLNEFSDQYIEEGYVLDTAYQWCIESDEYDKTISQHFTFYTNDGMIQEHHIQNVFETSLLKEKMIKYFDVEIVDDFVENEKVLIIGEKK